MDEFFRSIELESQRSMTDDQIAQMLIRDNSILMELRRAVSSSSSSASNEPSVRTNNGSENPPPLDLATMRNLVAAAETSKATMSMNSIREEPISSAARKPESHTTERQTGSDLDTVDEEDEDEDKFKGVKSQELNSKSKRTESSRSTARARPVPTSSNLAPSKRPKQSSSSPSKASSSQSKASQCTESPSPSKRVSASKDSPPSSGSSPDKRRTSVQRVPRTAKSLVLVSSNSKKMEWSYGPIFVLPRGRDISINMKRNLEEKFSGLGGRVTQVISDAKFLVVSPELSGDVVRREYLRDLKEEIRSAMVIVTIDWLRAVLSKSRYVDPKEDEKHYVWRDWTSSSFQHQQEEQEDGLQIGNGLFREDSAGSVRTVDDIPERYRLAAKAMDFLPSSSSLSLSINGSQGLETPSVLDAYATNQPKLSLLLSSSSQTLPSSSTSTSTTTMPVASLGKHGGQVYRRERPIPKDKLACQKLPQPGSATSEQLNAVLIGELSKMADLNSAKGDTWRAKSYSQAVAIIRTLDFQVTDSNQIRHRKGIGSRMATHIDEILSTGVMAKRVAFEKDPMNQALVNLKNIYGVGEQWAMKLYKLGYHDIQSIRLGIEQGDPRLQLSKNQLLGVRYYEDLQQRIKRNEMESILEMVKEATREVYGGEEAIPDMVVEIVGSYRRGKSSSGDIDIILTSPSHLKERLTLVPLIRHLQFKSKLITDVLTLSVDLRSSAKDQLESLEHDCEDIPQPVKHAESFFVPPTNEIEPESETFMGICYLPKDRPHSSGIHRRIDIKSYPAETFAFALLYFTGSAHFNRSMRYYAKNLGYSLSDKGLYPCTRFSKDRVLKGDSLQCRTEEDIFTALGLEYRAPRDRNCDEIVVVKEVEGLAGVVSDEDDEGEGDAKEIESPTTRKDRDDDDDGEGRRIISDDDEEEVALSGLPTHFLSLSVETLDMFLSRCPPSSYKVRSPWIRLWNAPEFYVDELAREAAVREGLPLNKFDELDDSRNLRRITSALLDRSGEGESRRVTKVQEAVEICSTCELLSGKWTLTAKREEVDTVWGRICRCIVTGKAPLAVTGVKVNSIAFRKRKHNLSVLAVYVKDIRHVGDVRKALMMLRNEAGVIGVLKFTSEAVSFALQKKSAVLYSSVEGLEIELGSSFALSE